MTTLSRPLITLATIHGTDCSAHVDAATGDAFTTLASFKARADAIRAARRALKDSDTITADEMTIRADAMRDENRADCRAILKASASMSRRERALLTTLATKGV